MRSVVERTVAVDVTQEAGWVAEERAAVGVAAAARVVGVGGLLAVAAAEAVVVRSHPTALVAAAEVGKAAVAQRVVGSVVRVEAVRGAAMAAGVREEEAREEASREVEARVVRLVGAALADEHRRAVGRGLISQQRGCERMCSAHQGQQLVSSTLAVDHPPTEQHMSRVMHARGHVVYTRCMWASDADTRAAGRSVTGKG